MNRPPQRSRPDILRAITGEFRRIAAFNKAQPPPPTDLSRHQMIELKNLNKRR
ncbi:MAG: hypothetical protein OXF02_02935 [Simkaniaceae bacterium]|nr:hypothetical protein [Simkaniaceae bacterium]